MKNLNIKSLLTVLAIALIVSLPLRAQEDEQESEPRPVRDPFESTLLIDNQSMIVNSPKTLQFDMLHRFGTVENGTTDFFGLYAAGANIRLGLSYTIMENLQLGVGFSKLNNFVDFNLKYAILRQTRSWSMPVSVTYYGNAAIDPRGEEVFGEGQIPFKESVHRMSFFHQLMIATRFSHKVSVQISPMFAHFNAVDTLFNNDALALGVGGRYKFSPQTSVIFEYVHPFASHDAIDVQPNISLGIEVATSSHEFQVFISTYEFILPQNNIAFNVNEFGEKQFLIGFNITRLWNF